MAIHEVQRVDNSGLCSYTLHLADTLSLSFLSYYGWRGSFRLCMHGMW